MQEKKINFLFSSSSSPPQIVYVCVCIFLLDWKRNRERNTNWLCYNNKKKQKNIYFNAIRSKI